MKKTTIKYLTKLTNDILTQITSLGSYPTYIIILILLYTLNYKYIALQLLIALIIIYALAIPIRLLFFKERPIPKKYTNLLEKTIASSMPSLHSTRTTYLFLALSSFFQNFKTTIFLALLTILILYSRIHTKKHHKLDIIIGILLGIITNTIIEILL